MTEETKKRIETEAYEYLQTKFNWKREYVNEYRTLELWTYIAGATREAERVIMDKKWIGIDLSRGKDFTAESVIITKNQFDLYISLEAKLKLAVEALDKVVTLMTGAPTIAPMTDEMVLNIARESLEKIGGM